MRAQACRAGRLCAVLVVTASPATAVAHGFGQRFDLPLPLWLWLTGAALTVLLSFAAVIDFLPATLARTDYPQRALWRASDSPLRRAGVLALRLLVVLLLAATIAAGLWGTPDAESNLAPTMFWVIFWVGTGIVCALLGDVWTGLHPLRSVHDLLSRVWPAWDHPYRPYPRALGAWPAVVALFVFAWCEHLASGAAVPANIGVGLLAYSIVCLAGMRLWGRDAWLQNAEMFSVAFAVFGRFAPLEWRRRRRRAPRCPSPVCPGHDETCSAGPGCPLRLADVGAELCLRPPGSGLLNDRAVPFSQCVFVLLLLAGVSLDGLLETALWRDLAGAAEQQGGALLAAVATTLHRPPAELVAGAALLVLPLLYLAAWVLACLAMAGLGLGTADDGLAAALRRCMARFVLTLVPIAIAYHVAHYLSLLVQAGQRVIPLLSDPLGRGWDLFGTAAYVPDLGLLGVRALWLVTVVLIVVGHVLSVYLAHVVALDLARDRRHAVRAEVPLLILMVAYTMASLWLLAQPIMG